MATALKSYNVAPNPGDAVENGALPVGSVILWTTATPPLQWLECDGSAVGRTTYPALYSVIGTTYGAGDGSTTFNLPNTQGITIRGYKPTTFPLAATGGEDQPLLTASQIPAHAHTITDPGHRHQVQVATSTDTSSGAGGTFFAKDLAVVSTTSEFTSITINDSITYAGSPLIQTSLNVINEYLVLKYIIKAY
jgi:microcystin-dependent protein